MRAICVLQLTQVLGRVPGVPDAGRIGWAGGLGSEEAGEPSGGAGVAGTGCVTGAAVTATLAPQPVQNMLPGTSALPQLWQIGAAMLSTRNPPS
jgi:hypothetical protein